MPLRFLDHVFTKSEGDPDEVIICVQYVVA